MGLFGLVRNVTSGARSASRPAAAGMSIVKSSRRGVGSHSVRVPPAMIGCIEYDGTKPAATRPGPPNACSTCWRISFEPLAAHRFAQVSGTPVARVR